MRAVRHVTRSLSREVTPADLPPLSPIPTFIIRRPQVVGGQVVCPSPQVGGGQVRSPSRHPTDRTGPHQLMIKSVRAKVIIFYFVICHLSTSYNELKLYLLLTYRFFQFRLIEGESYMIFYICIIVLVRR